MADRADRADRADMADMVDIADMADRVGKSEIMNYPLTGPQHQLLEDAIASKKGKTWFPTDPLFGFKVFA